MNDREWDDYIRRNPMSPYPRVQHAIQTERQNAGGAGTGGGGGVGSGDGGFLGDLVRFTVLVAASPVILSGYIAVKLHERLGIFKWTDLIGDKIARPKPKVTFSLIAAGGVVGALTMILPTREGLLGILPGDLYSWFDRNGIFVMMIGGAVAGWCFLPAVGGLLQFSTRALATVIVLPFVLFAMLLVYTLLAAIFGWPMPTEWLPNGGAEMAAG